MAQNSPQNELQNPVELPEQLELVRGGYVWVRPMMRPILSKADLRIHFQLQDNRMLLARVITPAVLSAIGMDLDTYKGRSSFTMSESILIYRVLNIQWLYTGRKARP